MAEIAGPPNPKKYPIPQLQGRDPEPKRDIKKALAPMALAQLLDLLSTEKPTGFLAVPGTHEANPLPGMQAPGMMGTMGRMGWGAAELALAAALMKHYPTVGKAYRTGSTVAHTALVGHNQKLTTDRMIGKIRNENR